MKNKTNTAGRNEIRQALSIVLLREARKATGLKRAVYYKHTETMIAKVIASDKNQS